MQPSQALMATTMYPQSRCWPERGRQTGVSDSTADTLLSAAYGGASPTADKAR